MVVRSVDIVPNEAYFGAKLVYFYNISKIIALIFFDNDPNASGDTPLCRFCRYKKQLDENVRRRPRQAVFKGWFFWSNLFAVSGCRVSG